MNSPFENVDWMLYFTNRKQKYILQTSYLNLRVIILTTNTSPFSSTPRYSGHLPPPERSTTSPNTIPYHLNKRHNSNLRIYCLLQRGAEAGGEGECPGLPARPRGQDDANTKAVGYVQNQMLTYEALNYQQLHFKQFQRIDVFTRLLFCIFLKTKFKFS